MNVDKLTRNDLMGLEEYAAGRDAFRRKIMEHKKLRVLPVGPNATLHFEDRLTMQYQVQEMLRAERIFEADGIQEELDAYNPLVPDGSNLKATFMIEFAEVEERRVALENMLGIEDRVWARVADMAPVFAVADEDLERETETKTSSVHFLRFELPAPAITALRDGAALSVGIDHPAYRHARDPLPAAVRDALASDLD
ncbi:MAG: DUF3501 family protein [Gammaproteobacteria bacterium]|nr:DUF3501 family protein [Gammaproteobacteria bacterium]